MSVPWQPVYIFISSTFNDMHGERDYLVKRVFPELRDWCEKRRLHLIDIDLRWGVTEQDAEKNKSVVKKCLESIDDCRPFFVCFLGQRRGWVPESSDIHPDTYDAFPGLRGDVASNASVTEMEIMHSVIQPYDGSSRVRQQQAFFYLRDDSYKAAMLTDNPLLNDIYTNSGSPAPEDDVRKLTAWRDVKIPGTGRPIRRYSARWDATATTPELLLPLACPSVVGTAISRWRKAWERAGIAFPIGVTAVPVEHEAVARAYNQRLTQGRLSDFTCDGRALSDAVIDDLKQAISQRFPHHLEFTGQSDLDRELDQQEQFLFNASEGFVGRQSELDALTAYADNSDQRVFALTAPGGFGKSAILAKWVRERGTSAQQRNEIVCSRFIGQSDRSTTCHALLHFLLREMKENHGAFDDKTRIPDDPRELLQKWPDLLAAAARQRKVIIVLDALNQLESGLADLDWMPWRLPSNVKLVVSFKSDGSDPEEQRTVRSLNDSNQVILYSVPSFKNESDRRELAHDYLKGYLKQLDEHHLTNLINLPGSASENPLYLKIILSELRVFGDFETLEEKITTQFGQTPQDAFAGVLRRLEEDPAYSALPPAYLAPLLFGLLGHARRGLSADEMARMIVQETSRQPVSHQDALDAVYLYLRQIRPFLAQRDGRYDFFYESFRQAAKERYAPAHLKRQSAPGQRTVSEWHQILARHFLSLPVWQQQPTNEKQTGVPTVRQAGELPYHLTHGQMWGQLEATLTDLQFIEAKCTAGLTYDLVTDYQRALDAPLPRQNGDNIGAFSRFVRGRSHVLSRRPDLAVQDAYNWVSSGVVADRATEALSAPRHANRSWLRCVNRPATDQSPSRRVQLLEGHTNVIRSVALTNTDGSSELADKDRWVVTGSIDKTIRVWDTQTGASVRTLQGHKLPVLAVAVSPDGRHILSGEGEWILRGLDTNADVSVRVWNLANGTCLHDLRGHTKPVVAVAWTPDSKVAFSASEDQTARAWDVQSGTSLRVLRGHSGEVNCIAVSPNGVLVATGSSDRTIALWDVETGRRVGTLTGHTDGVGVLVWRSNSQLLSGGMDGTLRVWDCAGQKCLQALPVLGPVRSIARIPGRSEVLINHCEAVELWDITTGKCTGALKGHTAFVSSIVVTADGGQAVTAADLGMDFAARIWDLSVLREEGTIGQTERPVFNAHFVPGRDVVLAQNEDGGVSVLDSKTGQCLRVVRFSQQPLTIAAVSPDGKHIVAKDGESGCVWDLDDDTHTSLAIQPREQCRFSQDGLYMISTEGWNEGAGKISAWATQSWQLHDVAIHHGVALASVDITADARKIVAGSHFNELAMWDIKSGLGLCKLEGHCGKVACLALTPDGTRAASAVTDITIAAGGMEFHNDDAIRVWDLTTGRCLRELEGHPGYSTQALCVTPDGTSVISGHNGGYVGLWNIETGKCDWTKQGHRDDIHYAAVSADGAIVATATEHDVAIWDRHSGNEIARLFAENDVRFSELRRDGQYAVVVGRHGRASILKLENVVANSPCVTAWLSPAAGKVRVLCPSCRAGLQGPQQCLGAVITCANCHTRITVNARPVENHLALADAAQNSRYLEQCCRILQSNENWVNLVLCLTQLRNAYLSSGKTDDAQRCRVQATEVVSRAIRQVEETRDRHEQCRLLQVIAHNYHQHQSLKEALQCFQAALQVAQETDDVRLHAGVLGNLGVMYRDSGALLPAIECFERCLVIDWRLSDRSRTDAIMRDILAMYAGVRAQHAGQRPRGNPVSTVRNAGMVGQAVLYWRTGQWERAREAYAQVRVTAQQTGDAQLVATSYYYLASSLVHLGRKKEAISPAVLSWEMWTALKDERVGMALELVRSCQTV